MTRISTTVSALALFGSAVTAQPAPNTILIRGDRLAFSRKQIASHDKLIQPAFDALIKSANAALTAEPLAVTQKGRTPPSGDKHDYMSLAPYWWPDTTKPDGQPYIRRDGVVYPPSRVDHDGTRFSATVERVEALALAYYFTGVSRYSTRATELLRVFFLDPLTRMSPHLKYAQAVTGVNDGRGIGIIETHAVPQLVDALVLLRGAPEWSAHDDAQMTAWCRAYLTWLTESKNGKDEAAATNNHGTFYDAQVAALALYAADTALARRTITETTRARIASQITPDGKLARELERTRPLHYSLFDLDAFTMLAEMGRHVGVDLWNYKSTDSGTIMSALRFVAPYADSTVAWPTAQVSQASRRDFLLPFRRAAAAMRVPEFHRVLQHLPSDLRSTDVSRFGFPAMP